MPIGTASIFFLFDAISVAFVVIVQANSKHHKRIIADGVIFFAHNKPLVLRHTPVVKLVCRP